MTVLKNRQPSKLDYASQTQFKFNILKLPKFAAITPISLDHQDFLGNSVNKIAFEKLGILNKKSANLINKQKPSVMKFIHSELKRRKLKFD